MDKLIIPALISLQPLVFIYLAAVNLIIFFVFGIDKWKARRSTWRIREVTLLVLAALGGSIGAWLGMRVWHHKTKHKKFKYGIPLILVVQIIILILIFYNINN